MQLSQFDCNISKDWEIVQPHNINIGSEVYKLL